MNDLPNLQAWCESQFEKTSIKMHPQSAPLTHVVEELMGSMASLRKYQDNLVAVYNSLNERITQIEEAIKQEVEPHSQVLVEDKLPNPAVKLTKKPTKVDKKEAKK